MPKGGRKRTTWTKETRPKSPGRPKGSKDRISRTFKGSLKAVFEEIATKEPDLIYQAVIKGLKAPAPKSFQYLQLMTVYIDGRPTDAYPADEVKRAFREVALLFHEVVADVAHRRRFLAGLNQLIEIGQGDAIDAQTVPTK